MISFHASPLHSRTFCELTSLLFHALHLACWGARGAWRLRGLQHFVYESILLAIDVSVGWKQISPLRWESSKVAKCTIFLSNMLLLQRREVGGCACPWREEVMAMNPEAQAGSQAAPRQQHRQSTTVLSPPWPPLSLHLCLFIASSQCSHVWSELIQNVGYTAKNCWEQSCFHCIECELKEVQM